MLGWHASMDPGAEGEPVGRVVLRGVVSSSFFRGLVFRYGVWFKRVRTGDCGLAFVDVNRGMALGPARTRNCKSVQHWVSCSRELGAGLTY